MHNRLSDCYSFTRRAVAQRAASRVGSLGAPFERQVSRASNQGITGIIRGIIGIIGIIIGVISIIGIITGIIISTIVSIQGIIIGIIVGVII